MHFWTRTTCALILGVAPCAAQASCDPLIGTVTTPDGTAIVGAKVEVFRAGGRGTNLLDLDYKNDFRRVAATPTDARGRFAVQLPIGLPCRVVVDHAPYAIWLHEDCLPGEDLRIQLQLPATFRGTLTRTDGTPVTATLRAWMRDSHDEAFRGSTDERGHFRFERVPPGPLRVEIAPDRATAPRWFDVDLVSGQDFEHNPSLEPGVRVFGRVTDRATGKPIVGARIGEDWTLFRAVMTDADGRYELHGYSGTFRVDLTCVADGYVKQVHQKPKQLPNPYALDLQLVRGQTCSGRIVDQDNKPLANVYVQAFGFVADSSSGTHDCIAAHTGADGSFHLRGLHPDVEHMLVVRKDGFAMSTYSLPEADQHGIKRAGQHILKAARVVRGRLTDAAGKPIPNAGIALIGYNADRDVLIAQPMVADSPKARRFELYLGHRRSRTDHLGRFAFGDVPSGRFHVEALDDRLRTLAKSDDFAVAPLIDPEPIELVR